MTARTKSMLLIAVQLLLVLSLAASYVYERRVYPRVWVRSTQMAGTLPLRGRYVGMQLLVDVCGLPRSAVPGAPGFTPGFQPGVPGAWQWTVKAMARDGRLVVEQAPERTRPGETRQVWLQQGQPCERARLLDDESFFVGDRAKLPLTLKKTEELWVEVTVPPSGPPRPVQLAVSGADGFHVLPK